MVVSARGRCGSERLVSVASSATTTSLEVLLEAGDELADTEVSDHGLKGLVVLGIDLVDLGADKIFHGPVSHRLAGIL